MTIRITWRKNGTVVTFELQEKIEVLIICDLLIYSFVLSYWVERMHEEQEQYMSGPVLLSYICHHRSTCIFNMYINNTLKQVKMLQCWLSLSQEMYMYMY